MSETAAAIAAAEAERAHLRARIELAKAATNAALAVLECSNGALRLRIAHSGILPTQLTAGTLAALDIPPALFAN